MLQKDITVLFHISLQDKPEILLVIWHGYFFKLGSQAVCYESPLLFTGSEFLKFRLTPFKLKGPDLYHLGLT